MTRVAVLRFVTAAAAVLVAASPAAAKERMLTTVCGANGCTSVPNPPDPRALVSLAPGAHEPDAAPFYGVTLRAAGRAEVVRAFVYVPSAGVMRVDAAKPFWTEVPPQLRPLLEQVTADVEPYPAPGQRGDRFPAWPALVAAGPALALLAAALRRVRRRVLAAVGLAALAVSLPGVAAAKNWGNPALCGPAECAKGAGVLMSLPAGEARRVPVPAPYYELPCRCCPRRWYIPSARAIAPRGGSTFTRVTYEAAAAFDRLAARVKPFPPPRITAAFVGGRRVRGDAGTYARLFELESTGRQPNRGADWVQIELRSARDTPWTNGAGYLAYSASENLLQRGPERFRLPAAIAARLERAEAITPL
jgi:hypothetical protein